MEGNETQALPYHLLTFNSDESLVAFASGQHIKIFDRKGNTFASSIDLKENGHSDLIRSFQFSPNDEFFVSGGDDKQVKLWDTKTWTCVATRKIAKKVSNVLFAPNQSTDNSSMEVDGGNNGVVIFSDKFGDVYTSSIPTLAEPVLLLGHVSTIMHMILSPKRDYLFTAVRDEKIRVSHYPAAYDIQAFCVGHIGMVTRVAVLTTEQSMLVSGSGGTLRLWNYMTGQPLHSMTLPNTMQGKEKIINSIQCSPAGIISVIVEGESSLLLYVVKDSQLTLLRRYDFDPSSSLYDAVFDSKNSLWCIGSNPLLQCFTNNNFQFELTKDSAVAQKVNLEGSVLVPKAQFEKVSKELSFGQLVKPTFENVRSHKK